mmetsp:Transcript_43112/g.119241  ORF Transcript_43112/g.119241 Transcript_43112/m.119241 type:complete len:408 (-) Transcript_43112:72-1295(-)
MPVAPSRGTGRGSAGTAAKSAGKGGSYKGYDSSSGRGRGGAGFSAPRPEQKPSSGPGGRAIAVIEGKWHGSQDETYDVAASEWRCVRRDATGYSKAYWLAWSADRLAILWGEKFCLYSDGLSEMGPLRWYRCDDERKARVAFTWRRPEDYAPAGRHAATVSSAPAAGGTVVPRPAGGGRSARMQVTGAPTASLGSAEASRSVAEPCDKGAAVQKRPGAWAEVESEPGVAPAVDDPAAQLGDSDAKHRPAAGPSDASEAEPRRSRPSEEELDVEEDVNDAFEKLMANAPSRRAGWRGTTPATGPGAQALAQLRGVWWGPTDDVFRVDRTWSCEHLRVIGDRTRRRRHELSWDAEAECLVLGGALVLDPMESSADASKASWRPRDVGDGTGAASPVLFLWTRHNEEGEQ